MREVIITDLTRFSTDEKVCTAAIDIHTGECVRPMPYLKGARCAELNIQPGAILKGDLVIKRDAEGPHVEDAHYSRLTFVGPSTAVEFKRVLDISLSTSVGAGFGVQFVAGQKHIPAQTIAKCSIITICVDPQRLRIHEDDYKPGKIKASFVDGDGLSFSYLSITDLGFHDYAKRHQRDGRLHEIQDFIREQDEVYLRVGLSRRFQPPGGKDGYWLQVNGIYTFPDYFAEVRSYEV